jgi:hypothetical protein
VSIEKVRVLPIAKNGVAMKQIQFAFIVVLFLCARSLFGQSPEAEKEIAVIELGGAVGRSVTGAGSNFGGDLAAEITPVEHWLELEAGVSPLFSRHSKEWDIDFLFKKPWQLSKKVEFMVGAGPLWAHVSEDRRITNSPGVEAVLDFMFWPGRKHRFGWFLEPGYDHTFGRGLEQSVGMSFGLLIAIP